MYDNQIVTTYKGITITICEGLYSCLLDPSIESEFFTDILTFIDNYFSTPTYTPLVSLYIIGEYIARLNLDNILN